MLDLQKKTVREIALEMPATTRVFEAYKIDYCCHGNTMFDDACQSAGAASSEVTKKIEGVIYSSNAQESESFTTLTLNQLIDHILEKHHAYTESEIHQLTPLMEKVASRHGEHNPYLFELKEIFKDVCDDLGPHMLKEEGVLFPYIRELETNFSLEIQGSTPRFGTVANPVRVMKIEHEKVGDLLSKMRSLSNDYLLPDGACPSFTALYHRFTDLERDIHQHIHLENNLLFPKAIELEQKTFPLMME